MSVDPKYNPDGDLFLGIDEGYYPGPNVTTWFQPDARGELVTVLYAHYQWLRTNEENACIALAIHQDRGYGRLTGGWGDPSAPQMIRAYSLVFGVDIQAIRRPVAWGEETFRFWLRTAHRFKGRKGIVFSQACSEPFEFPDRDQKNSRRYVSLLQEVRFKEKHQAGGGVDKGSHHGPDTIRYFFAGWQG